MLDYGVRGIGSTEGKAFVKAHHYSHGIHNGPICFGLFGGEELIGVLAVATPCSENVRASLFGSEYKAAVSELHRLVVLDGTPKNTESWFISRALHLYSVHRPGVRALVSFADSTEGHVGIIYQAVNALYCGTTGSARFYVDGDGRLRHPRQNGVNIGLDEASARGWTATRRSAKHRYVLPVGGPASRRWVGRNLLLPTLPYPKMEEAS